MVLGVSRRILVGLDRGRIGDALWTSSLLPHFKAQGYHVTLLARGAGFLALRHDPNVDFLGTCRAHSAAHGAVGPIERVFSVGWALDDLLLPESQVKRADPALVSPAKNENFVERLHRLANCPPPYAPRFYPTEEERSRALGRYGNQRSLLICLAGSAEHKIWPYVGSLTALVLQHTSARVFWAGGEGDRSHAARAFSQLPAGLSLERINDLCGEPVRETLALAQVVSAVVGPETGVPLAACMESNRKAIWLGQSSAEKLTRDWVNTVALAPSVACHPCHIFHQTARVCPRGPSGRFAACAEAVTAERVFEVIADVL